MTTPVVRSFNKDIEARFPEAEAVPENLKDWWMETRENLDRLKDKISELERQIQQIKAAPEQTLQFTEAQALQLARFVEFWEITSNGSLIPYANNTSDIGNAERKVRDIYELV
jgi:chromosome segregation ATPase